MPSSRRVWAMTDTKNVRPRMNSIVSAWIRSSRPRNDSRCCCTHATQPCCGDLDMPRRRRQPEERRDDDQQHPVGQRVLVDLVPERAEEEEPEDRREHFGGEQPPERRTRPVTSSAAASKAQPPRTTARQHDDSQEEYGSAGGSQSRRIRPAGALRHRPCVPRTSKCRSGHAVEQQEQRPTLRISRQPVRRQVPSRIPVHPAEERIGVRTCPSAICL